MIKWAKKLYMEDVARLYEQNALGIQDDELCREIGWALYARCDSIISVTNGFERKCLRCPVCGCEIALADGMFICRCGFQASWEEFRASYKGKQLYGANALPVFTRYQKEFLLAEDYSSRMLAIDSLLHSFHVLHSYRLGIENPDPTDEDNVLGRPSAANLIEGGLSEVVKFLDALSESPAKAGWKEIMRRANGGDALG